MDIGKTTFGARALLGRDAGLPQRPTGRGDQGRNSQHACRDRDPLLETDGIRRWVFERSGTTFSEAAVGAFLEASAAEAFWLTLEPHHRERALAEELRAGRRRRVSLQGLRDLALVFAEIVDGKSPFTASHSTAVASLAALLGALAGLDAGTCEKLRIAGLLHDLGKLRVPDEVLEKAPANWYLEAEEAKRRGLIEAVI